MNNIQDDYKFARSSKEAFGSNFYPEDKINTKGTIMKTIIIGFIAYCMLTGFPSLANASRDYGSRAIDVVNKNNNVAKSTSRATSRSGANSDLSLVQGGVNVPHQAPSFGIGTMFPTAPCQGTKGGGFSVPWGGAALSGSHTLKECEIRETIRTVIHMEGAGIDTQDTAVRLLCKAENAKDLPLCDPFREQKNEPVVGEAKFEDMLPWNWGN